MTVLADYQVQSYRHEDQPGMQHLAIARRDGEPIPTLADLDAVCDERAPGADLLHVHLWLRHAGAGTSANGAHGDDEDAAAQAAAERVASVAAAIPPAPAATVAAPRARRPRRAGGTLNLRDREIGALAELIDEHVHLDDDSERAETLRAVRVKLARLPQAVSA